MQSIPGVPPDLQSLAFADRTHGWAAGSGIVLATVDGGRHWRTAYVGAGSFSDLDVLGVHDAWAVGSGGVLRTRDGVHWRPVSRLSLTLGDFVTPRVGFGLASASAQSEGENVLVRTTDGGGTWRAVAGAPQLADACFYSRLQGLGVPAGGGGVLATSDGGRTWRTALHLSGTLPGAEQLRCTGDGAAWFVAAGAGGLLQQPYAIYRSGDFGSSWQAVAATPYGPAPGDPRGMPAAPGDSPGPLSAPNGYTAYIAAPCDACPYGTLTIGGTSDAGKGWSDLPTTIPQSGGGSPSVLDFRSASEGWLLTSPYPPGRSVILHTSDAGRSWQVLYTFMARTPTEAVSAVTASVAYGVGTPLDGRAVLRSGDGGRTWQTVGRLPSGVAPSEAGLAFPTARHGFAVTQVGLLETADGGRTWGMSGLGFAGSSVSEVAFATPFVGCAVVQGQADFVTRDAGRTWAPGRLTVPAAICAASAADPPLGRRALAVYDRYRQSAGASSPAYVLASAVGGGSVWIGVYDQPRSRLYVLTAATALDRIWQTGQLNPIGMSVLNSRRALLWSSDARLFQTSDAGLAWTQVP